jgi:hypothetical protein
MKAVSGDILKSKSTGEFYKVKKIKEQVILLEAESIPNKVWLGNKECLEILYDKVEDREGKRSRHSCSIDANRIE